MQVKKLTKLLGLSALSIVAVMAMNASAAQAIYTLAGGTNTGGVLLLHLGLTFGLGELLIKSWDAHLHCTGGTGLFHLVTNAAMTTLSGSGTADLTGCTVQGFKAVCTVHSPGAANGLIAAQGAGSASMNGTETLLNLKSANFSTFEFNGALCPYNELEMSINGEVKFGLKGEAVEASHSGTLDDIPGKLFYSAENAELHGVNLATPIAVTATKIGGGNWAVQLSGL